MKIEIHDSEINVQEIMEKIRENIRNRNYEGEIDFELLDKHLQEVSQQSQNNSSMANLLHEQSVMNRIWSYSADNHLTSHRKFLGRFIVFGKKVIRKCLRWYMNPVVDHQVHFNATIVRMMNQLVQFTQQHSQTLSDLVNQQFSQAQDFKTQMEKQQGQLERVRAQVEEQQDEMERVRAQIEEQRVELEQFRVQLEEPLSQFNSRDTGENKLDKLRLEILDQVAHHAQEMQRIKASTDIANNRLRRIERNLRGQVQQEEYKPALHSPPEETLDFDYYLFEEYYRGSREEIMKRQQQYLHYFSEGQYVLDLGCGRGEFLELMVGHGIRAEGVELNDDMIAYCRERGFTVHKADLLEHLDEIEDNSVDGIFLGQVIEHLHPQQLIQLIRLAHGKLKPNGYFIAETPNPRSLSIFAQSFYMDLTHTKPVHPYTAKFLLESEGYREIEIHYFSPNSEALKLPELIVDGANQEVLKQFNQTLDLWHQFIFGEQDYYIAGRK